MGEKIRISQCMIVKNEEKNIEKALSWGKGILYEQIVVDTGSTDRTIEIARQMGAVVYSFPWIDDFAAAKNFAIGKAKGEWIAFLDADEYLSAEDAGRLPAIVERLWDTPYEAILTGWVHLRDDGSVMAIQSQIRIFKNLPKIRYKRRIHEYLCSSEEQSFQIIDAVDQLSIFHTGYGDSSSRTKVRSRRNFKLILEELRENPDDYEMHGFLGNEYIADEKLEEARECYEKAVALMPDKVKGVYDITTSVVWYRLLEIHAVLPGTEEARLLEIYEKATEGWPEEADYDYLMGKYYVAQKNYGAGEQHLKKALNLLEQYGNTAKSSFMSGDLQKAYELLAICCFNNGNLSDCVQLTAALLKESPYLMSTLVVMLSALKKDEGTGGRGIDGARETMAFLGNHFYHFNMLKDKLFVLQAAMGAHYTELEKVIKETFSPEELTAVELVLEDRKNKQS